MINTNSLKRLLSLSSQEFLKSSKVNSSGLVVDPSLSQILADCYMHEPSLQLRAPTFCRTDICYASSSERCSRLRLGFPGHLLRNKKRSVA